MPQVLKRKLNLKETEQSFDKYIISADAAKVDGIFNTIYYIHLNMREYENQVSFTDSENFTHNIFYLFIHIYAR